MLTQQIIHLIQITFTVANGTLTKSEDNPSNVFATINRLLGSDVIGSTVEFNNGNTLAN